RAVKLLSESQLRRIRRLIDENIGNDLSVSDLSSELKMSASYFSRCFKATFGIPPHTFVVDCKIIEAARLVIGTEGSLEEIAEKVGFSNMT
ncbi:AraC family transcriptional regulator, partial [Acinetobacter baumannii]